MNGAQSHAASSDSDPGFSDLLRYAVDEQSVLIPKQHPLNRVLDLCARDPAFLFQIAQSNPSATLVAVGDDHAKSSFAPNVQFLKHDWSSGTALPSSIGKDFDLVHASMLFSELPASAFPTLLASILELLKPGGYLQIVDFAGVHTYERHTAKHAIGQAVLQGSLQHKLRANDAGLQETIHLATLHLPKAGFVHITSKKHGVKTGKLQSDARRSDLAIQAQLAAVTKARQKGFGKAGEQYSYNGHTIEFPDDESGELLFFADSAKLALRGEGWDKFMGRAREAMQDGMQQQVIAITAQKPIPLDSGPSQYPQPTAPAISP